MCWPNDHLNPHAYVCLAGGWLIDPAAGLRATCPCPSVFGSWCGMGWRCCCMALQETNWSASSGSHDPEWQMSWA